jgi:hypothetical protein
VHRKVRSSLFFVRWIAVLGLLGGCAFASAADPRFSATLGSEDKATAGVSRLSSDQVAVLDALVRRDTAKRAEAPAPKTAAEAPPAEFSRRLTADERRNAGFEALSPEQGDKLDALIERFQTARLARTFLAPPAYLAPPRRVVTTERKEERRVHGSFTLSYGFGKGGYEEKTGSMVVHFEDPDRGLTLSVGYAESHIKNGYIYRDPLHELRREPELRPAPVP